MTSDLRIFINGQKEKVLINLFQKIAG